MTSIRDRLAALGYALPPSAPPAANYLPYARADEILAIAGQIGAAGAAADGPVGTAVSVEAARGQAERAALNLLAVLDAAAGGDASRIRQVLRLGVFIAAAPGFGDHGAVADGASDLLEAVLGERGPHARAAVGVASLPAQAAVEVDALVWMHR